MNSWIAAIAFLGAASAAASPGDGIEIRPGTRVEFADANTGARVLSSRDVFVQAMSPFDRSSRLKTDKDVEERDYLAFVARQTREWTSAEKARARRALESFGAKTALLDLHFPSSILLVKTTGLEEGMSAYCRGVAIVIPKRVLSWSQARLEYVIFHELFHIYRAHYPAIRRDLYKTIGFHVCPEITLPPELQPRKITNPDAPLLDSYIEVRLDRGLVAATPVLFARTERYDMKKGGEFFDSMVFKLLILSKANGGFQPAINPGRGVDLRDPEDLPDYLGQVGRNTQYIIHPEEILADNFVLMINGASSVPTPRILEEMRSLLTK